ncbi:hypothetical protein KI387_043677, partial [Taxus chinensis]
MAPKKGKGKGKAKKQELDMNTNEEWYVEIQYPDGVMMGKEWESHLRNVPVSDYNHRTNMIEKEMTLELVHPTSKKTPEGLPIYNDDVK